MQPFTLAFAQSNLTLPAAPIASGRSRFTVTAGAMEDAATHQRLPIRFALGGKNIYYFLTELERGHLQVMPLAYDVRARAWLDSTASMTMHENAVPSEAFDWRDRSLTFNTSCYSCHVSQLATNYDLSSDTYRSTWSEPGINCETCHGPAAAHVAQFQTAPSAKLGLLSMKQMSPAQRNDACASCHAKNTPITAGFTPGERFFDHYDLTALESADFYPDGRDLRENYTITSWRMSECVRKSQLDCIHCHTSSGRYKFADPATANNACLPCHAERVRDVSAHTHHPAASAASRCVSCHMPTTEYARMTRSDHSMRPPAPAATLAVGSPNACNACHSDRDAKWADARVRNWYVADYQAPVLRRAALIQAARQRDWRTLSAMLAALHRNEGDEIFRASLIRLLGNCRDRAVVPELLAAVADPSPVVRASAVEAMGEFPDSATLRAAIQAATDDYRLVRIRAGAVLATRDPEAIDPASREPVAHAVDEYLASLRTRPDDFTQHLNLGVVYADRQQPSLALAEYQTALRLRPDYAPAWVNAAFAYDALGRKADAEDALRRAVNLDPNDPIPPYNLALLLSATKPAEAIEWARRAVQAAPSDPTYRATLADLLARTAAGQ
jgi:tetratricopeptide (TPR) repeat protein